MAEEPVKRKGRSRKPQPAASLVDWALSLEQEREKEPVLALTAISSSAGSLMGLTCLNHSISTRSDSFTTSQQPSLLRNYRRLRVRGGVCLPPKGEG